MARRNANTRNELSSILEMAVGRKVISPEGRDWLKMSIDTFHDLQHDLSGYPDSDGSLTVVQKYTSSSNQSAPEGVGDTDTWSMLVFNMSYVDTSFTESGLFPNVMDPYFTDNQGTVFQQEELDFAGSMAAGPLVIAKMKDVAGARFFPAGSGTPWTGTAESTALRALPVGSSRKRSRIIGQAFEVHNTTADVYKQGAVTSGMFPQTNTNDVALYEERTEAGAVQCASVMNMLRIVCPPANVEEAMEYPNALKWGAEDGVYAHITFNGVENPMRRPESRVLVMDCIDAAGPMCMVASFEDHASLGPIDQVNSCIQSVFANTNCTFSLFSGLSAQTSLEVVHRCYTEMAPRSCDAFLPLATPSAPYDVRALQLYAAIVNEIPIACKVHDNASGDFARTVAHVLTGILAKVSPIVGTFLTPIVGPEAAAIGAAAGAGLQVVSNLTKKKNKPQTTQRMTQRPRK
jgi:hypothetical protein